MSAAKMEDFEDLTYFLGDYKSFQILMMALFTLSGIPNGYMSVITIFISATPNHYCNASINSTSNSSWIANSCSLQKRNESLTETEGDSIYIEKCQDGWIFSTDKYTATIVSEWDLVCEDEWKVPLSTSLFFVGVFIGSLISGQISDRFGRKPVFFFTMALQGITSLIQATSVNWTMFCILNFLRGIGQISNYVVSLILGCELLGKSARVTYTLLCHAGSCGLGYALLSLYAYFIRDWRMLLVASAILPLLLMPTWWVIPESPRWLLQRGQVEEAERIIRNVAKMNRVTAPEVIFRTGESLELMQNQGEDERMYTYLDLIRTPNLRNIIFITIFLWLSSGIVFNGLALNSNNMHGNPYLNFFFLAAVDMVTYIATWLLINRATRPNLLFCSLLFCGIMLLVTPLIPEDMHVMLLVFTLMGKICSTGSFTLTWLFSNELLPTVVRNMGLGIASTASRIGIVICPYIIYFSAHNKILPFIIFGSISLGAASMAMLLPDTRNSKLPDLISEVKPLRRCCCSKETALQTIDHSGATEGCK